jgi:hypothetical protein
MDITKIGCGLDSTGSKYGLVAGSYKNGNEAWPSIRGREFLDHLSD